MKHTTKLAAFTVAIAAVTAMGCQDLLDVNIEGQITDGQINSPAAAQALRLGALGSFLSVNGGNTSQFALGGLVNNTGLLADEIVNRTTTTPSPQVDQRINVGSSDYGIMQTTRARAFEALGAITEFMPTVAFPQSPRFRAEMYFTIGFLELQFAEDFCAGVPLSARVAGVINYGQRLTTTQMTDSAIGHFNQALALLTDTLADSATATMRRAVRVAKARAFNYRGVGGAGGDADSVLAILGGQSPIPTNFVYAMTFGGATTTSVNTHWFYMQAGSTSGNRASVGDSINPDGSVMPNSLPFASANDPRLPVLGNSASPSSQGNGNLALPLVRQNLFRLADTPINLVSGLDARLLEAEVQMKKGNIGTGAGQMTGILNSLRGTTIQLSREVAYAAGALPALPAPANQTAAVRLFFREKAFWTWGRGQRVADLRRMIRQWGPPIQDRPAAVQNLAFTEDKVFPVGNVFDVIGQPTTTINQYGHEINFTFTGETANPNVPPADNTPDALGRIAGTCIDRNA
jgi:hypothetical protein